MNGDTTSERVQVLRGETFWTPFQTEFARRLTAVNDMSYAEAQRASRDFLSICWPCADYNPKDKLYLDVVAALGLDLLGQNDYLATVGNVLNGVCTLVGSDDFDTYLSPNSLIRSAVIRGVCVGNVYLIHSSVSGDDVMEITCKIFASMRSGFGADECIDYIFRCAFCTHDYFSQEEERALQACLCAFWDALGRNVEIDASLFDDEVDDPSSVYPLEQ